MELEIAEKVVLLRDREAGRRDYPWLHRVVLSRLSDQKWVTVGPDFCVDVQDFTGREIIAVSRGAEFPGRVEDEDVFKFEDDYQEELGAARRGAQQLLGILGDGEARVMGGAWLYGDPAHSSFAEIVPGEILAGVDVPAKGAMALFPDDAEDPHVNGQ